MGRLGQRLVDCVPRRPEQAAVKDSAPSFDLLDHLPLFAFLHNPVYGTWRSCPENLDRGDTAIDKKFMSSDEATLA